MPTGYTAGIYDGTEESVRHFLAKSARAMGLYIMQRDDDSDAPLKAREVSEYTIKSALSTKDELDLLMAMDDEAKAAEFAKEKQMAEEAYDRAVIRNDEMTARYDRYINAVNDLYWPGDNTDDDEVSKFFRGFKKFVTEQLDESKRFDCGEPSLWFDHKDVDDWYASKVATASRMYKYATERLAEETEQVARQNLIHTRLLEWLGNIEV